VPIIWFTVRTGSVVSTQQSVPVLDPGNSLAGSRFK